MREQVDTIEIEEIKPSIKNSMEVIRDIYKADICATFLIIDDMHEDEKLEIFAGRLELIRKAYNKRAETPPNVIKKYLDACKNNPEPYRQNLIQFLSEVDILKFCFHEVQNPDASITDPNPKEQPGKLWKYNYRNRPYKWVIFKEYTNNQPESSILYEGLTAYAVRTKQDLFISDSSEMGSYRCVTHLNAYIPKPPITPECKMIAFFLLRDLHTSNIIGLLKVENYSDIQDKKTWFKKDSQKTQEVRRYLPLLEIFIEKFRTFYSKYSYQELYGGMKLLDLLNKVLPEGDVDSKLYKATHHLLCVLYRKEYIGHNEIMGRVTNYAEDISDGEENGGEVLNVFPKGFFQKILERRREHEDLLLYKTEGYRDHFMHQFHVFVLGYIILHHIGLEKITSMLNKSPTLSKQNINLNVDNVLRIWFMTAFMHDAAYLFEYKRFGEGMANFFSAEWGYDFKLESVGPQFLDSQKDFVKNLSCMIDYFTCEKETNRQELLPCYIDSIRRMDDHGVLGAIWLMHTLSKRGTTENQIECYLSAFSISVHNVRIFKELKEGQEAGITFESFPIAFLLAFCDTVQIWGRTRQAQEPFHPELRNFIINDSEIICQLFYKTKSPASVLDGNKIESDIAQYKDKYFRCKSFQFKIEFYKGEKWKEESKPFHVVCFKQ